MILPLICAIQRVCTVLVLVCLIASISFAAERSEEKGDKCFFEALLKHRREAWVDLLDRVSSPDFDGVSLFHDFSHVLSDASPSFKKAIEEKVLTLYERAPKEGSFGQGILIPPRRSFDGILSLLWNPSLRFKEWQASIDARRAYKKYFAKTRKYFSGSSIGNYSSEDVLDIAEAVRRVIQQKTLFEGRSTEEPSVEIFGSVPNGKATLGHSDLDIKVSPEIFQKFLVDAIQSAVSATVRSKYPTFNIKVNPLDVGRDQPMAFYASFNPIVISVRREKIKIDVYPFSSFRRGFLGRLEGDWQTPDSYEVAVPR